jgi:hypothetical protein
MTLYEVRARGLYGGSTSWSFGYKLNSTALIGTVASTFNSAITTWWTTATHGYANLVNADVTLVDTVVYVLNASQVVLDKQVTANAQVGTNTHDSLAFQTSVWVAMFGDSDTQSDRGGMMLPTPSNDNLVGEIWTAAMQTSLKDIFDPFFVSMRGLAGYSAVKINTHTNRQGDPPFTQHFVDAYKIGNKPSTVRRRTKKRKPTAYVTGTI